MNLTSEQLTTITEWAEKGLAPIEIAIVMGLKRDEFKLEYLQPGSQLEEAFNRGYLKLYAALNAKIISQAKNGNSQAQDKLNELLINIQNKIISQ